MSIATPADLLDDVLSVCAGRTPYSQTALRFVASRFVSWAIRVAAIEPDPSELFTRRNIERFIQQGLPDHAPASRGNMRSKLLRMSELILDPRDLTPRLRAIQPANPLRPYTADEVVALRSWARNQTAISRRRSATALLCLGLGAGLAAAELSEVKAADVDITSGAVTVRVHGSRPRSVPVLDIWADELRWVVGQLEGEQYVFRSHRQHSWPNVISNFVDRGAEPRAQSQRMRSTWVVGHLEAGTNVALLVRAAGVDSLEAFTRYLSFVTTPDEHAALAQLTRREVAA